MDSKRISPGELAKGQFITVLSESIYVGDVLEVLSVCLPFVVVRVSKFNNTMHFDTRKNSFMELSKEYVDAVLSK